MIKAPPKPKFSISDVARDTERFYKNNPGEGMFPFLAPEQRAERAMDDVASGKIKTPEEFMDKIKEPRSPEPGRAYALFLAGASLAELSRAFMVSEAEIEAALRGHIARRERERK